MRVLSLFDGMACGMLAMQDAGITVDRYVAFEIDKYAVQTSSHNFPMIEHRGDVFQADFTEFRGFDFLVGGSPCTYWSIAQKNNRETEASGMGWELFSQYVRALHEAQPMFFIYENNKSMSNAIRESITQTFGFEPICINSALVSAQNRQRLYWVGKRNPDGTYSRVQVDQPEDRGILLRDVLCAESICMRYQRSNEAKKMRKQYEAGEIHHGFRELSELHPPLMPWKWYTEIGYWSEHQTESLIVSIALSVTMISIILAYQQPIDTAPTAVQRWMVMGMAKCKDCLHYEACSAFSKIINAARDVEKGCEHYTRQLVRCKECRWAKPYKRIDGQTGYFCGFCGHCFKYGTNWERVFEPIKEADDYCSYGERREGE